jgi:hypothetical protein
MGDQPDLLEELARVYARAAVDELLALLAAGKINEEISGAEVPSDSIGCKIEEDPTHSPIGRIP